MNVEENAYLPAPTLKTDNIYLRAAKLSDYPAIKNYRQNVENCRYIRPPESDAQTLKLVEQLCLPWKFEQGRWNGIVICLAGNDNVVGEIVFNIESFEHQRAEIGYRIDESVAGQGICTEAAALLINHLIKEVGVFKIVAKCDPRNFGSFKVMEKLGFKREAFFRDHYLLGDEWTDQLDYGLLSHEWLKENS
jgi:RimJ/RimL family protein N-acetyltransferase